jgi:mRNA-degrading endonuclease RelE of RelBE toxin-antitoxin system
MSWQVRWHAQALRDLRRLSTPNLRRVSEAIDALADTEAGDTKRLTGYTPPRFRLRVGDVRVLFRFEDQDALRILRVLPRGRAYRDG